jgi:hypothetical protein
MAACRREAAAHDNADIELPGGGILFGLVETGLQIFQHVRALRNHSMVHPTLPAIGDAIADPMVQPCQPP